MTIASCIRDGYLGLSAEMILIYSFGYLTCIRQHGP